jgi:hypothetical protein
MGSAISVPELKKRCKVYDNYELPFQFHGFNWAKYKTKKEGIYYVLDRQNLYNRAIDNIKKISGKNIDDVKCIIFFSNTERNERVSEVLFINEK